MLEARPIVLSRDEPAVVPRFTKPPLPCAEIFPKDYPNEGKTASIDAFKSSADKAGDQFRFDPLMAAKRGDFMTLRQTCPWQEPRAQYAFKNSMIRGILQFTLSIAFRCVLHRSESRDIHC